MKLLIFLVIFQLLILCLCGAVSSTQEAPSKCEYQNMNDCAVMGRDSSGEMRTLEKFHYVHLSKTAGTLTHNLLHALNLLYPYSFYFQSDTQHFFRPVENKDFYVGSIRNVCTWYFSNWGYESTKGCDMIRKGHLDTVKECNQAVTHHLFLKWMKSMVHNGVGWASVSFWQRYLMKENSCGGIDSHQIPLKASDCMYRAAAHDLQQDALNRSLVIHRWVRQESYEEDMLSALKEYSLRRRAGPLNISLVEETVRDIISKFTNGESFKSVTTNNIQLKDPSRDREDFILDSYFGSEDSPGYKLVRKVDKFLFDLTGGCGHRE